MIAGERKAGDDGLRLAFGYDLIISQGIADDAIVALSEEAAVVEADAGAAMPPSCDALAEPGDHIGMSVAPGVPKRDQKTARRRFVVVKIDTAPGVDIDGAVGRDGELAGMAEIVGEDGGAETGGQGNAATIARAAPRLLLRN